MSADLFAEFGGASSAPKQPASNQTSQSQSKSFDFFNDFSTPQPQVQQQQQQPRHLEVPHNSTQAVESDDDWGDFEGPSSNVSAPAPAPTAPAPLTQSQPDPFSFQSFGSPVQDQPPPYQPDSTWNRAPVYKAKKSYDPNVLFDAEEEAEDDDDFGDFEETPASPPPASYGTSFPRAAPASGGLIDLMGDLDISQRTPQAHARTISQPEAKVAPARTTSSSPQKRSTMHDFGPLTRKKEDAPKPTTIPTKKDDSWDSFDDWEASIPTISTSNATKRTSLASATPTPSPTPLTQPGLPTTSPTEPGSTLTTPPTNVPPPAHLLTLFPPLFTAAHEKLFKPLASQPLPMRNRLLSDPAIVSYLRAYVTLAHVAARIIAGRKHRWKRDTHLAQSMRIGPASSRASSGMKLVGIDKQENVREEREVADVVRLWKEGVGRLRSAVAGVNQRLQGTGEEVLGPVPNLEEEMKVKMLKQSEGGVPSRSPCWLCGLKREERVVGVEGDVADLFGEWWVENVGMHRGCRNFWVEHREGLMSR